MVKITERWFVLRIVGLPTANIGTRLVLAAIFDRIAFALVIGILGGRAGMLLGQSPSKDTSRIHKSSSGSALQAETVKPSQKETGADVSPGQKPESVDLHDYLRKLLKKPPKPVTHQGIDFTVVPIIGSRPPLGMIFGVGASVEFLLGNLEDTRVSALNLGASFSTSKQVSITWAPSFYGNRNHWQLQGDNHFQLATQNTYGLGTSTRENELIRADFHSLRFFDSWYFQIIPNLYAGAGIQFGRQWNIKPGDDFAGEWGNSPFVIYSQGHGLNPEDQTSAGPSFNLIFDNCDNQNDPAHGVFAAASYRTYFKGFLGGSSQWQEMYADFRTYRPLTRNARHRLALWTYADLVTGGTAPYFSLPATGGVSQGRPGRGYSEYRFRGEQLLNFEAEYRATLTRNGFLGMVFFANGTTVSSSLSGERLFDSVAAGAGFGFRFRLQKRSKTNLCVDFGFGREGSHGVYIGIGEAF